MYGIRIWSQLCTVAVYGHIAIVRKHMRRVNNIDGDTDFTLQGVAAVLESGIFNHGKNNGNAPEKK